MSTIREWLVGVRRDARHSVKRSWPRTIADIPGVVIRPRGPKVQCSGTPVSVEVLASEADAIKLRAVLGPEFSVQLLTNSKPLS